jgi:Ca-activated chloride channel homolog
VAVDERVVNDSGQVHRVTQPVDLPSGWEPQALFGSSFGGTTPMGRAVPLTFAAPAASAPAPAAPAPAPSGPAPRTGLAGESTSPPPMAGRRVSSRPTAAELAPDLGTPKTRSPKPKQPDVYSPHPEPTSPRVPPPELAAFASTELRALRAQEKKDVWARAALLTALAERIFALLDHWEQTGEDELARKSLAALARDLATPTDNPNMADSLWFMALATLETFSKPRPRSRNTFWKR